MLINIHVSNNNACAKCGALLTSGMVGARCAFTFGAEWAGLSKTAVFVAGNVQKDVLLTENECVIPWEVLAKHGYQLSIGVYGVNANGDIVIPTIYANVGVIQKGADPSGDESTDPTLPVWAQIQNEIGNLDELETEDKTNIVNAINEAAQSGGGGTSDHAQLSNRDAANQHPISAIDGLQTALNGKQPVGDYALRSEIPSVPTALSQLSGDSTHRVVTDAEKSAWNAKQSAISDLAAIRSGASKGATAVQPESGKGLFSGNYNDLTNKPTIPAAVTESTVSGWGFTKNTGTYSKPSGGIPKTDLASSVQSSLGKADTALQSVPDGYATETYVNAAISAAIADIDALIGSGVV